MRLYLLVFTMLGAELWANQTLNGKVTQVIDGDSVLFETASQRSFPIHIFGVDAPEKNQDFSAEAAKILEKTVLNKTVEALCRDETDKNGRRLCTLMINKQDVAAELLAQGSVWVYSHDYGSSGRYHQLQRYAQDYGKGLWASRTPPVAPWLWRYGANAPMLSSASKGFNQPCPDGYQRRSTTLINGKVINGECEKQ